MTPNTVDECETALRGAILSGALPAGSRLPPERSLAAQFQVHRATVRSALARLTAAHLVTARQGSGYEVLEWTRSGGPDLLGDLLALAKGRALEAHAADLLRVRRALARAVLETLAETPPSAERRATIDAAIDAFEREVEGRDVDRIARADLDVVAAIVDATGSAVLQLCMNPVASLVGVSPALRQAIYADATQSVLGWRALAAWLGSPDPAGIDAVFAAMVARDQQTLARLGRGSRRPR